MTQALDKCADVINAIGGVTEVAARQAVAFYAVTARRVNTPPERMLVLLKKKLTTSPRIVAMLPEAREQRVAELVAVAIDEYYRPLAP